MLAALCFSSVSLIPCTSSLEIRMSNRVYSGCSLSESVGLWGHVRTWCRHEASQEACMNDGAEVHGRLQPAAAGAWLMLQEYTAMRAAAVGCFPTLCMETPPHLHAV